MSEVHGYICGPRIYKYKGWTFEYHAYLGPWPLTKTGERRKRAGDVFWKIFNDFLALPEEEQKKLCLGGGCQRF